MTAFWSVLSLSIPVDVRSYRCPFLSLSIPVDVRSYRCPFLSMSVPVDRACDACSPLEAVRSAVQNILWVCSVSTVHAVRHGQSLLIKCY